MNAETDGERAVVAYYDDTYKKSMACLEGIGLKEVQTVKYIFVYQIKFLNQGFFLLTSTVVIARLRIESALREES